MWLGENDTKNHNPGPPRSARSLGQLHNAKEEDAGGGGQHREGGAEEEEDGSCKVVPSSFFMNYEYFIIVDSVDSSQYISGARAIILYLSATKAALTLNPQPSTHSIISVNVILLFLSFYFVKLPIHSAQILLQESAVCKGLYRPDDHLSRCERT